MLAWISEHQTALAWGVAGSVVLLVLIAAASGFVLVRLPPDRFTPPGEERAERETKAHPGKRIVRNIAGYALMAAGLAMLVLPGPGVLVVLIGIVFADFPGKARVLRWILFHDGVLRAANRLRARFGRPPLERPPEDDSEEAGVPGPEKTRTRVS